MRRKQLTCESITYMQLKYISAPEGPATLSLNPSKGASAGGFKVTCILTGFKRIDDVSSLRLSFNGRQSRCLTARACVH